MKDTYDFTYAQDLRHFIGLLLDDYCPTQLKIFDSDIVYDVIKDLKQFKMKLTGNRIFGDCCLECNALLNKDLEQLKEDLSYTEEWAAAFGIRWRIYRRCAIFASTTQSAIF